MKETAKITKKKKNSFKGNQPKEKSKKENKKKEKKVKPLVHFHENAPEQGHYLLFFSVFAERIT